jgi:hypothetical protein
VRTAVSTSLRLCRASINRTWPGRALGPFSSGFLFVTAFISGTDLQPGLFRNGVAGSSRISQRITRQRISVLFVAIEMCTAEPMRMKLLVTPVDGTPWARFLRLIFFGLRNLTTRLRRGFMRPSTSRYPLAGGPICLHRSRLPIPCLLRPHYARLAIPTSGGVVSIFPISRLKQDDP